MTMTSTPSWFDPAELAALAIATSGGGAAPPAPAAGPAPERAVTANPNLDRPVDSPVPAKAEAADSEVASATPAPPDGKPAAPAEIAGDPKLRLRPFNLRASTFDDCMDELLGWVRGQRPSLLSVFVTDRDGLPLVNAGASADYIAACAGMLRAMQAMDETLGGDSGVLTVAIRTGEMLHLVAEPAAGEVIAVGLVAPTLLDEVFLQEVRRALTLITATLGELQ